MRTLYAAYSNQTRGRTQHTALETWNSILQYFPISPSLYLSCSLSRSLIDPPTLGRMICIANYKPILCACVRALGLSKNTNNMSPLFAQSENLLYACAKMRDTHASTNSRHLYFLPCPFEIKREHAEGRKYEKRRRKRRKRDVQNSAELPKKKKKKVMLLEVPSLFSSYPLCSFTLLKLLLFVLFSLFF